MVQLRGVLFDLDGTLADSYAAITASVNHVRAAHGLPPLAEWEVRRHVGRGPDSLLAQTVPGADPDRELARYRQHHPTVLRSGTRLLPGAAEAIAACKTAGLAVAICSNKPRLFTRQLLDHFQLSRLVDLALGPEDVARPKPAPDMVLAALSRLQIAASDALYVGDMVVDIQTARQAGVAVWVVPTGSDDRAALEAARPERILRDLHELLDWLPRPNDAAPQVVLTQTRSA
jgi:2-phosphoglycolate phosphatase